MKKIQEAVVLAGGLGTRLRSVVSEIPKPMAPIGDQPFLAYVLTYLASYEVRHVVLSVGYKHEVIKDYFGEEYKGIQLTYAVEEEPLGTGGGIKNALSYIKGESAFLLNGDTFFEVNLDHLSSRFVLQQSDLTMSLKEMEKFDRYGVVTFQDNRINGFADKKYCDHGWINGGVYIMKTNLFENLGLPVKFSFETDFLEKFVGKMRFISFLATDFFIDIGIPEDYERAQLELKEMEIFKNL